MKRTETQTELRFVLPSSQEPERGLVVLFIGGRALLRAHGVQRACRIGRDSDLEISVDDVKMSRVHAELLPSSDGLFVIDRGSRNGTFVDGRKIEGRTALPIGAIARMGRTLARSVADVTPFSALWLEEGTLVGGPSLGPIRETIATMATTSTPILVVGETGTGKERVALAVHQASGRAGPLVTQNCAALPSELVESELFGHARGAFSGSDRARRGLFRTADGGTLLLDEIGDLPLSAQAKLLRVLETGEVRGVGEDQATRIDLRLIAATNRDLERMVSQGSFRADLLHRIDGVRIALPPLRDRIEDIPLLVADFLRNQALVPSVLAIERLLLMHWPGNVRELRHVVSAAAARARARGHVRIELGDLDLAPAAETKGEPDLEQRVIAALERHEGNVTKAARELGMRRAALYEHVRRLNLALERFRRS